MTYDSEDLTERQLERIIEMAWEGRTPFLKLLYFNSLFQKI